MAGKNIQNGISLIQTAERALQEVNSLLQLEMHFVLDIIKIQAIGYICWSRSYRTGVYYGLHFRNQPAVEDLIISEMKRRRRKEVIDKKQMEF